MSIYPLDDFTPNASAAAVSVCAVVTGGAYVLSPQYLYSSSSHVLIPHAQTDLLRSNPRLHGPTDARRVLLYRHLPPLYLQTYRRMSSVVKSSCVIKSSVHRVWQVIRHADFSWYVEVYVCICICVYTEI